MSDGHAAAADDRATDVPRLSWWRSRVSLLAIVAVTLLGAVAVVWGAFNQGTAEPLDAGSTDRLAHVCDQARHDLQVLPQITSHSTIEERAARVDVENRILGSIPAEAARLQPTSKDGAAALRGWVGDWHALLAARATFARGLRGTVARPELVLPVVSGAPITKRMIEYASTHSLPQCQTDNLQAEIVDGTRTYPTKLGGG